MNYPMYGIPPSFAPYRFVHLGVNPGGNDPGKLFGLGVLAMQQRLEPYLTSLNGDWYRYAAQNYVVWTNRDLATLTREINNLPGFTDAFVLATAFNLDAQNCNGMIAQAFW